VATLCRPLPVTVRIRVEQQKVVVAAELMNHGFFMITDGIYQLAAVSKAELSSELRQLLTLYHQTGRIARQEIGSMLPVRLLLCAAQLGISSSSSSSDQQRTTTTATRVLDLCASPGSKTLQALEVFPHATIIANDINANRLTILSDAVQRSGLSDDLIHRIQYTNQDASKFKLYVAAAAAKNGAIVTSDREQRQQQQQQQLAKFRVILCDVPCSGDGTCRKDPSILPQWKPTIGNQLHAVQLAILQRGLFLLKPGGYLCYSTCSMYPVENEAVVAAALLAEAGESEEDEGVVELVDCPTEATRGFRLEPGLRHWLVAGHDATAEDDTGMVLYESYENALERSPDESTAQWLPSMWSPTSTTSGNRVALQLTRCRRLWPHHQDSGGFFVAMFHKKKRKKQNPK
jgi:multisite-specific tRNA:(cytosine-C5)-methyltransferase